MAQFQQASKEVDFKIKEIEHCFGVLCESIDEIEEKTADAETIMKFKNNKRSLDELIPETNAAFGMLEKIKETDRHAAIIKKYKEEFESIKKQYERISKTVDKHLKNPQIMGIKDKYSVGIQDQKMEDQTVGKQEVFDQEEYVQQRNAKIKQISTNSKKIKGLATEIHGKVEDQSNKLDEVNREMSYNNEVVQQGNKELEQAVSMSKGNNDCLVKVVVAAIILLVIIVALVGISFAL